MSKLILNERKYAKELLHTKNINDITITQLIWLLSIYREGNCEEVSKDLESLHIKDFYLFKWKRTIENSCYIYSKYKTKFKEYESIELYKSELKNIESCKNDRQKKLLFTMYIISKYLGKNSEYNDEEYLKIDGKYTKKQIFDMSNISISRDNRDLLIRYFCERGLIRQNRINDNNDIWIKKCKEDNIVFKVDSFDNLGNQFLAFNKKDIKLCSKCGKPIKIKGKNDHSTKYCEECAKIELQKSWKESKRRLRR